MSATTDSESSRTSFLRCSLMLAGCVLLGGLALAPFAAGKTGSSGLAGVALAGAICLVAGLAAEGVAALLSRNTELGRQTQPLATMLLGMTIRMFPPLVICVFLAAQGASARQHLPFIVYLLVFYMVTLALETWLNVGRAFTMSRVAAADASRKSSAF